MKSETANQAIDTLIRELAAGGLEPADIGALLIAGGTRLIEETCGRPAASTALGATLDALHGLNAPPAPH